MLMLLSLDEDNGIKGEGDEFLVGDNIGNEDDDDDAELGAETFNLGFPNMSSIRNDECTVQGGDLPSRPRECVTDAGIIGKEYTLDNTGW